MVLVSFEKQFIFTKTVKSAGSSVEDFFQRYCVPPDYGDIRGMSDEVITDYGIVGYRGNNKRPETTWFNHMPAAQVRRYLGNEIWQQFFKFCVIRNPFDKVVSRYFFAMSDEKRAHLNTQDFAEIKRDFRASVSQGVVATGRGQYLIDGSVCMDFFIRYERLVDDVAEVCRRLRIERDVGELRRLKSTFRFTDVPISEFYDKDTETIVAQAYAFELEYFGYRLRD